MQQSVQQKSFLIDNFQKTHVRCRKKTPLDSMVTRILKRDVLRRNLHNHANYGYPHHDNDAQYHEKNWPAH